MSDQKPCLPECWKDHKPGPFQGFIYHALGCPKAEAPKDVGPGSEWQREAEENGRHLAARKGESRG